jgi:lantibiotic modifying enzyme
MSRGIAWVTRGMNGRALTGFSHGAAGVAWSLLPLAALTGDGRFRAAALSGLDYERGLFSPRAGNWPDLRDPGPLTAAATGDGANFALAWCHGAPGIGLARLDSLAYLDDSAVRAEIDVALRATLAGGFGSNHSLCHGDLGNLELLLLAGQVLGDPGWRGHADRLAARILDSIDREGWCCGVPLGVESPGLMTGLAGIGYGLLRLAEPARVPSVLLLAPPPG